LIREEGMTMGKILFVIGLLGIAFAGLYDKIVGKPEIIFGPRSYAVFGVGAVLVIIGLISWKK
jgi:hypothetical protein